ncbi:MAG: Gfo/Idh/MocA family oxidoreductase [Planctomycetota bacterium]
MKRRTFLAGTASAFAATQFSPLSAADGPSKLRLAVIGVANRGAANLAGVESENIVALCDVDQGNLEKALKRVPGAELFQDYRVMLDQFKDLDGVVVSTPDHHHAPATMRALQRGLPVYCEKPLTHTVAEARAITNMAREKGVATQMGTQIHAGENYRRVVEKIRAGVIGDVHHVHVWVGKGWGSTSVPKPGGSAPAGLAWNLWLGPAEDRPYTKGYHPANWRSYRDFGTGTLGDMGCHYMDLPFWALGLRYPKRVVAEGAEADSECCPLGLKVSYEFAASETHDEVKFTWYDGDLCPKGKLEGIKIPRSGVLFVGDKGKMVATYGDHSIEMTSASKVTTPKPVETIAPSVGHHQEWLNAIRDDKAARPLCQFDYSGPLTESVLLGTVAHQIGHAIQWSGEAARIIDDAEAQALLDKSYRTGWDLMATASA